MAFNFHLYEKFRLGLGGWIYHVILFLSLVQFDFSYSSATITLNLAFTLGVSDSKFNHIKAIGDLQAEMYSSRKMCHLTHVFFPLSLLQKVTNSNSEPIFFSSQHAPFLFLWTICWLFNAQPAPKCDFCFYYAFCQCIFVICNLSKSITHAIYKQKPPCKVIRNVYMGKKFPSKRDPGFMKVESLLGGRIYFHINRFWYLIEFVYKARLSLCRDVFSPYKHPLTRLMD